jgi:dipeptidyl-peptidase-4
MIRITWLAVLLLWSLNVAAENLSLQRILADPPLSGPAPRGLKFSPDSKLVTYLRGKPERSEQLDLWAYDISSGRERLLVDSNALLAGRTEQLSDEEKARRERLRIGSFSGIVDYQFASDSTQLLFPLSGALYLYNLKDGAMRQLTRAEDGFATDPKFSPQGRYVSFVRAQNLYALRLADDRLIALTTEGAGTRSFGMAEFVAQEEMDRLSGYWWAPDDHAIAFFHVDEAQVPIQQRFEIYADRTAVIEQRYPAAGTTNAAVGYGVVELPNGDADAVARVQPALTDAYLARLDWRTDSKVFVVQQQSRDQRVLELIEVTPADFSQRTLLTETSDSFVNLHNDLRWLRDGRFIWASERSGFKQLYLHDGDGKLVRALSAGNGAVDQLLQVNEAQQRVYFSGSFTEDLQKHVYVSKLDRDPVAGQSEITQEEGFHEAVFDRSGRYFLDTHSNYQQPPRVLLRDVQGKVLKAIEANEVDADHPLQPFVGGLSTPEFGSFDGPAGPLRYRLTKPRNFDPAQRWPVVVRVYGGPHVQVVNKSWDGRWGLFDQYLAQQGFIVLSVDNRGSARRGKAFEDALYGRMGEIDVADQVAGVRWLKQQDWVDPARVGVFGWSYGGYMTLMLLAQHSDDYACGVSVAPVSDWLLYDTHYTERYMDLPARNAVGYAKGDVLNHLDGLRSPLLLVHGMADDNVLFAHATRVMSALQERDVDFSLMTYPGGKHGINSSPAQRLHVYRQIAGYLQQCLQPAH